MQLANFEFRQIITPTITSTPGIYIYVHEATGKYFVRAMRNARLQKNKNNYPALLKEFLKKNNSEVVIYLADLKDDSKETLFNASKIIATLLTERGLLYKRPEGVNNGLHKCAAGSTDVYTVWSMTHKVTGAVYYFEEVKGRDVTGKVNGRMGTYNSHVEKRLSHINRVMNGFAKNHFPLQLNDWILRDLDLAFISEAAACKYITKASKQHLEAKEIVLNRVSNMDVLYYRNSMLKLPHVSLNEYLTMH